MTTKKDLLTFQIHFQCTCREFIDIDRFIKKQISPAKVELLCPFCEKKYVIALNYEEIK
jgi:redox-regulated HSP33 family molecular chaperone